MEYKKRAQELAQEKDLEIKRIEREQNKRIKKTERKEKMQKLGRRYCKTTFGSRDEGLILSIS